jgi:hypothetical protein
VEVYWVFLTSTIFSFYHVQRVQHKRLPRTTDETIGIEIVQPNKRLNAERLQKLESIAFAWSAKHVRKSQKKVECPQNTPVEANTTSQQQQQRRHRLNEAQWEDMYQRLLKYKEQHGNCLVPRKYEQDPKLATWVETQRVLWNRDYRKQETPTPPPEALEPAISGDEQQPPETVAVATTNDLLVEETKIKRLTPERKQKLDQLGFVWSLRTRLG